MNEKVLFDILLAAMFLLAPITFISLLFITAPYGRYTRSGWGPKINAKAGWIIQETPSVIVFAVFFAIGTGSLLTIPLMLFTLWQIHYVYRTYIFPLRFKGTGKRATLVTMLLALVFTTINGYLNGRYLTHFGTHYSIEWLTDIRFILGVLLFVSGLAINFHSDGILRKLRAPHESGYKIPFGGLFRFVSCPNYFGEIIEWSGWALATWSLPGLCFAVWTVSNLAPRAISHHKWYHSNFPDYPKDRKAVIPFLV